MATAREAAEPSLAGLLRHRRGEVERVQRVLFIAYFFPPVGGAGAQRSLKFVRYLPAHGFEPTVLTGTGTASNPWSPTDETLVGELPRMLEILHVEGPEPGSAAGLRRRVNRWLDLEHPWNRWWPEAVVRRASEAAVDVVLASMSPYSTAEGAARLSARLRRPWVADLRDPWALDEMMVYPTAIHRRRDLTRMGRSLRTAAAIVMNTPEAAARLRRQFPHLAGTPVVHIPNGFDREDFASVDPAVGGDVPGESGGAFRIVHSGYLHTELGRRRRAMKERLLGGAVRGVNILARSHVFLLEAVASLLEREPSLPIEVHLAGQLSQADLEVAQRYSFVHTHGYLGHARSVELVCSADLLFLPMHDLPPGVRATIVPGKTYEYLASGRPILAAVPEGDARDLLSQAGNARICRPVDVGAIAEAIHAEVRRRQRHEPAPAPAADVVERFERRALTAQLADLLTSVLDRPAAEP